MKAFVWLALAAPLFFDDFSHPGLEGLLGHGWTLRELAGHPGVPGARWAPDGVTLVDDPERHGNRLLRLQAQQAVAVPFGVIDERDAVRCPARPGYARVACQLTQGPAVAEQALEAGMREVVEEQRRCQRQPHEGLHAGCGCACGSRTHHSSTSTGSPARTVQRKKLW